MKQAIAFVVLVITSLLALQALAVPDHLEYKISVDKDGSAFWTVVHVTDIDTPVDGWDEFEQRLVSTIDAAEESSGRDMALDWVSLEMSTEIHWETSSKTIVYTFRWLNFSIVDQGKISFGDVFGTDFFVLLYGDGELYVTYPLKYNLASVSFRPDEHDYQTQTMHWYRTQDFLVGDQMIVLSETADSNENFSLLAIIGGSSVLGAAALGLYLFRQRSKQKERILMMEKFPPWQQAESDQEKILQLLKVSGGNLKQSEVCDKLHFSRAKTSLLLAEMEKNSLVRRSKKGKNKIIFPVERKEGRSL